MERVTLWTLVLVLLKSLLPRSCNFCFKKGGPTVNKQLAFVCIAGNSVVTFIETIDNAIAVVVEFATFRINRLARWCSRA